MDAGLACPDWPLCFGDFIPDYHPQVYFEFIHRVMAGVIMICTTIFSYQLLRSPQVSRRVKVYAVLSWFLLIAQAVMGGLTVLMQLHDKVVTLHLAMGTGFFALLLVIYKSLKKPNVPPPGRGVGRFARVLWFAVYGQIILGGLVASNYAANVCPEFPLCHGQLIPTLSGPIGLQVIHRLGAYTLFAIGLGFVVYVFTTAKESFWRRQAAHFMAVLLTQVGIGISNVLLGTPPLIAVAHLFTGTVLLGLVTRIVMSDQGA